jgi:RNA polymerase sigma-54 factor
MLKQNLSQKMMQKLSPQQIQLMKLLQIPTATLEQRIQEELESNPALDEGDQNEEVFDLGAEESYAKEEKSEEEAQDTDNFELDDYLNEYIEDDPSSYKLRGDLESFEENKNIPVAIESTFHDHLERQMGMLRLENDTQKAIAEQLIGSIDEDGYLRRDPLAIVDDLLFAQNMEVKVEEVKNMLLKVQQFDPPGVGACDLQECLLIQLTSKLKKREEKDDYLEENQVNIKNAIKIIESFFDEFSKKHYNKLKKHLYISEPELKEAIEEILKLNPKPASGHSEVRSNTPGSSQYVIPDFIVQNRDGELELTLNSRNAPDLRINDQYMEMLKSYKLSTGDKIKKKKQKEAVLFIKQKIDSAKWFIDAIKQRQTTLYKTMYTIMQFQYDFFLTGDERRLRPMILKDIAEITDLDISTVSRVANSKFVQTEFGTKRLKDFFSESLTTQDGQEVSTFEVKNILSEIITGESKRKPLSDEKLKDLLQNKGYNIARRTVAKYREQLNIPVARLRKEL